MDGNKLEEDACEVEDEDLSEAEDGDGSVGRRCNALGQRHRFGIFGWVALPCVTSLSRARR